MSMRGCHLERRGLPVLDLYGVAAASHAAGRLWRSARRKPARPPLSSAAAASSVLVPLPASAPAQPAVSSGAGPAASSSASASAAGFALPVPPAPASVAVDPQTSALLILDLNAQICGPQSDLRGHHSGGFGAAQKGSPGQSARHLFARPGRRGGPSGHRTPGLTNRPSAVLPTSSLVPTLTTC